METAKKTIVEKFDEDYFLPEIRNHPSNPKAFEAAAEKFENDKGFEVPFNYDNFRMKKKRELKKKISRRNRF